MEFSLTSSAATRLKDIIAKEARNNVRLRISVLGGGCSGFQYNMDFDDAQNEDDHVFAKDGVEVIIDETSLGLLKESQLDYVSDLSGAEFVVKNPNASSSCGCGKSFSI